MNLLPHCEVSFSPSFLLSLLVLQALLDSRGLQPNSAGLIPDLGKSLSSDGRDAQLSVSTREVTELPHFMEIDKTDRQCDFSLPQHHQRRK